jgi:MFS family permease
MSETKKGIEKPTIHCYLALTLITKFGISFTFATYVMFLISKGLNLLEVNLVNLVFFTTSFLCEIPTGAVADVFGRKTSFVCSCFLFAIGMFIYAASSSFWGFALAEMTAAVGNTFASGAFQAWLVDRLRHHGYDGSLKPVFSKEQQITPLAGTLGAVSGAFLADRDLAFPWIGGGIVMFIGGLIAMAWMQEEYFVRQSLSFAAGVKAMKETIASSINYGARNRVVRFILMLGIVQFFATQAPNMQWQPFFSQFLPNKTSLGFIFAAIAFALAGGAALAPWFLSKIKSEQKTLLISQIIIGVGIAITVAFRWFPAAISVFLIHEIARGVFRPLKDVYLNDNIPSKERATLISFEAISHHVGGAMGLLVSGFLAEKLSIPVTWAFFGALLAGSGIWLWRNHITLRSQ